MTRCVYLTFFGEYRGHGHPHESEPAITVPLVILAVFSVVAGLLNAAPLGHREVQGVGRAHRRVPRISSTPTSTTPKAVISVSVAAIGIGIAAYLWFQREELGPFDGLTERNPLARAGYTFLENKYYLDYLYENVIVASIKGPIARGAYWVNQHVIDKIVSTAPVAGRAVSGIFTYDYIDQKVVDGAVNEIAEVTGETGGLLRYVQSGRVQRYALLLFAAVGLLSLFLLLANI